MAAATPTKAQKIKLMSNDHETFVVDSCLVKSSSLINNIVKDLGIDSDESPAIPLPEVTAATFKKILVWLEHHKDDAENASDEISAWDAKFLKVDQGTVFDIIKAANFLGVNSLLKMGCMTISNMIKKCKTTEEMRKLLKIKNDFSPEEEAQIVKENAWCEE